MVTVLSVTMRLPKVLMWTIPLIHRPSRVEPELGLLVSISPTILVAGVTPLFAVAPTISRLAGTTSGNVSPSHGLAEIAIVTGQKIIDLCFRDGESVGRAITERIGCADQRFAERPIRPLPVLAGT